jgi:deoxyribonuclease V
MDNHHQWAKTLTEAKVIQETLRTQVITEDCLGEINYVAGVDVAFKDDYAITQAAVAVLSYRDLQIVDRAIVQTPTTFPYVPGYLSFREIPAILAVLPKLKIQPDVILCDGQGLAHPRRLGLACHLGVILDLPTIGVAKSLLIGKHDALPLTKGSWVPLIDRDETIGAVLRSRDRVKPIYISIGNKVSLPRAIDLVLNCLTKYRLPETTRWADRFSKLDCFTE